MPTFKKPTTISQALALVDYTLNAARTLKADHLLYGTFATDADRIQQLAELGGITAALAELETFAPCLGLLRGQCRKAKPTTKTYEIIRFLLEAEAAPLSRVTRDIIALLPQLAGDVAQNRAAQAHRPDETFPKCDRDLHPRWLTAAEIAEEVAVAHEQAIAAKVLLAELPAALARVRELAEAGACLIPASTWLN